MRTLVTVGLAAFAFAVTTSPSFARDELQWCAQYSGRDASTNCGFYNYAQCQAAISGAGGTCYRNPRYVADTPRRKKRTVND